jgi:hypothetical protein
MALISQPGSDYQLAEITLDAGNARDIMLMLLDAHARPGPPLPGRHPARHHRPSRGLPA